VPLWFQVLAAAEFDPLRAQEIEERLSMEWWTYYREAMEQRARVENAQRQKGKKRG